MTDGANRGSRYGREMQVSVGRDRGEKRQLRSIEEKFRKYEVRAEGYEFVPALMHSLRRYVYEQRTDSELDRRLRLALEEIPEAEEIAKLAVQRDDEIPRELKSRVFSPRYLDLPLDHAIEPDETRAILERAKLLQNRSVAAIPALVENIPELGVSPVAIAVPTRPTHEGCCCPPPRPPRHPPPPPPPRHRYEIAYAKLYCVDESDPEWGGSDEPYVVFGVMTEEMAEAGSAAFATHTPVYGGVDDGETRPGSGDENLRLFGFTGPRAIDSSVLVTASCFENDLGDPTKTTNAIRTALTAVATKAAAAGGVAGWIVAGVAVVGIGVTYLVDLVGADDGINGTQALSLTQAEADGRTASVNPHLFPPLHFDGGDDDGIYDVFLKLTRV